MEISQRVSELEELGLFLTSDSAISDLMIRALIASHPNPQAVKAAFQVLLSAHETEMADHGFSTGRPAKAVGDLQETLKIRAARWMSFFPTT